MNLEAQLEGFEGRECEAYPDPLTGAEPWTIGIGHTGPEVCEGLVWTDAQIDAAFTSDVAEATRHCVMQFPWFHRLNDARQAVLIGMCFQMGMGKLLKFAKALGAIRDERWPQAAGEMLDSAWARQTPKRARRLARQMETGEWQ
jgi:lysozyme